MSALIRDSAFGQLIRYATGSKIFSYPEERPDFQVPSHYLHHEGPDAKAGLDSQSPGDSSGQEEKPPLDRPSSNEPPISEQTPRHRPESIEEPSPVPTPATEKDLDFAPATGTRTNLSRVDTRVTMEKIHTRRDLEQAYTTATLEKGPTTIIVPEKLNDGTILVDWYDTDDPENPQNWSLRKKCFVTFQIWYGKRSPIKK